MDTELKTVMGQMNIVDGLWVSEVPNALAVREPTSGGKSASRKGDLFVVVELRGFDYLSTPGQQLSQSLATTLRNTYYQTSSSITASLRRALADANSRLRRDLQMQDSLVDGEDALPEFLAGVVAVAVRGEDVFVATVGPAAAYVATPSSVTRFPDTSPWLDSTDAIVSPDRPAMGQAPDLEVDLFHVTVQPGDKVVLADSRFAAHVSDDDMLYAVSPHRVEDALTRLGKIVNGNDCTALVVEIQRREESRAFPIPGLPSPPPAPTARRSRPSRHTQSRERPLQLDLSHLRLPDLHLDVFLRHLGRTLAGLGKALLSLAMVVWTGLRTIFSRTLPDQEYEPSPQPAETTSPSDTGLQHLPQRSLRTIAALIPAVMLIVVGVTYWQRGIHQENEFSLLLSQAQDSYQQSMTADEPTARILLAQADEMLARAEAVRSGEPALAELRTSIEQQRDRVDRIERLYWVGKLYTYDVPPIQPRRVVNNGLMVYVVDAGSDRVYQHVLDETGDSLQTGTGDPVLVRRAQQVDTAVIGELIDITWMPAGGDRHNSRLLILESAGLIEYDPQLGLHPIPIVGTESWVLPVAGVGYGGNFYVLDPSAGQIFRYLPSVDGYTNPPDQYISHQFANILSGAIDLAIDGFVYVLYADGNIRKFQGGAPVDFQVTGIDKPFNNPTAIYTAPDQIASYIYVADAGNQRIVQLSKDGRFVRQIKTRADAPIDFSYLRSIFVDELTGKLFLLDNHSLYVANIPPLQFE